VVAYFCHSVRGFLLLRPKNQSDSVCRPSRYLPNDSGIRGAKGTVVLLRAGIDKGAQLDWRGYRCKKSGALADTKGGNPIELLLLLGLDCNRRGVARTRDAPGAVTNWLVQEEELWGGAK
jgi:hypothetical protein